MATIALRPLNSLVKGGQNILQLLGDRFADKSLFTEFHNAELR